MFGMDMGELLVIAIVAIIFLGPDKLPDAMVKVAKFFKSFKNSINDVKNSFEQEMKIQELKEEALVYKKKLDEAATSARKVITFDELEEIKKSTQGVNESLREMQNTIQETTSMSSDRVQEFETPPVVTEIETKTDVKKEEKV